MTLNSIIYDIIKDIKDPEKPNTLEELNIINEDCITINRNQNYNQIKIEWIPTNPNCSLALNIGLLIRNKLREEIPYVTKDKFKIDIIVKKGTHSNENESKIILLNNLVNKQLNDKERYLAALENPDIIKFLKNQ